MSFLHNWYTIVWCEYIFKILNVLNFKVEIIVHEFLTEIIIWEIISQL